MINKITEKYIALVEDSKVPFRYFVLTFLAFVALRNFIEIFSDRCEMPVISFELHFHFYLFYTCIVLIMMLLFSAATGEEMAKTARLILFSSFIIFLPPILDLVISGGQGYDMGYLSPQRGHGDLLLRYLTFAGSFEGGGITIGLKIETALLMVASFSYFKAKKVPLLKSLLFVLLIYTVMFGYAITHIASLHPEMVDVSVPWWSVVLALGFSAATGVFFGIIPAFKAAVLHPIDVLRHE